jgi:putative ABC transport system permease protein
VPFTHNASFTSGGRDQHWHKDDNGPYNGRKQRHHQPCRSRCSTTRRRWRIYWFLDDDFGLQYLGEERLGQILGLFAALAVAVACMGVFALATCTVEQRTKEIGVRKALGAVIPSILAMLLRELAWLVLVANLVAWPLTYVAMDARVEPSPVLFVAGGVLVLVVALVTVSHQALRAARANPIDALRHE